MIIKYWLFRVCKNQYLDYLRKNKSLQGVEIDFDERLFEDSTLEKIMMNEERKRIYYKILRLQPSYKEVITLYYYCDFNLQEIASMVGISQGAARTLLFRARKKLKQYLEEETE